MSLDMIADTHSAVAAGAQSDVEAAEPSPRLWLYELGVAAAAAFGAVLASALSVVLYLR